jgi:alpha,alpha-trehalase
MKNKVYLASVILILLCLQIGERHIKVPVKEDFERLIQEEDTDGDKKITIDDPRLSGSERGDKRFWLKDVKGNFYEITGVYYLSNLLQELKLAEESGIDTLDLNFERIFESPTDRISRMIKEIYWDGLTRRIDEEGIIKIIQDEKVKTIDGYNYIYVPNDDTIALNYFLNVSVKHPELKLKVVKLPARITATYVKNLNGYHGLLTLSLQKMGGNYKGVPFVVPGGRFNEMYGWDSYFIVLGLLESGKIDLAKGIVDNFIYEIEHYGKILNANRTYYLTRSQPPFLTSMIRAVYSKLLKTKENKEWLKRGIKAAIKEYTEVWISPEKKTKIGLSRYYDPGIGPPPEVEEGHFDAVYKRFAMKYNMNVNNFEKAYKDGKLIVPEIDEYFKHDRAMRESGHDRSYRLLEKCADLVTVDLNSLLYKYEIDIAQIIDEEFSGSLEINGKLESSRLWYERAKQRKDLINRYLWDEEKGMYFDYNFVKGQKNYYVSATTFYPLWAGLASNEQAEKLIKNAIPLVEAPGGILASTLESRGEISDMRPPTQWDYPYGWAPHQIITWYGLLNYGYDSVAQRLIYKWLYTITVNAVNYNGTIAEKYDVVKRNHEVFVEYGNIGIKFSYLTREGFGWTNASYLIGLKILPDKYVKRLNLLIPPEYIF